MKVGTLTGIPTFWLIAELERRKVIRTASCSSTKGEEPVLAIMAHLASEGVLATSCHEDPHTGQDVFTAQLTVVIPQS